MRLYLKNFGETIFQSVEGSGDVAGPKGSGPESFGKSRPVTLSPSFRLPPISSNHTLIYPARKSNTTWAHVNSAKAVEIHLRFSGIQSELGSGSLP